MIGGVPAYVLLLGHLAMLACGLISIKAWFKGGRPVPLFLVGVTIGCIALAILTFLAVDPPNFFWDFRIAYYPAGKAVLSNPASLAVLVGKGVDGFVNLPIVAYLFAPFSTLPLRYAISLFTLFGLAMTVVAWLLLISLADLKRAERWLLLLLFAANGPLQYSIKEGNTSQWVLAALAGGMYLQRARRPVAAGALLGLAAVLKLPLLLFGIYFLLRREWRSMFGFVGVCCVIGILSVGLFGWDFHVRWFELCVRQFSSRWIAAFNVQSIQSFVLRLQAAPELLHDWTPYSPGATQRLAGSMLVGLLYLAALWCCKKSSTRAPETIIATDSRRDLEFLLVLCLAAVSSPLSWSHYYAWLLLPAAFFLGSKSSFDTGSITRRLGWTAILLATLLVRPLEFSDRTLMTAYSAFGASYLLFSGLLWIGLIGWSLTRIGTMTPPLISVSDRAPSGLDMKLAVPAAGRGGMAHQSANVTWTARRQGSLL